MRLFPIVLVALTACKPANDGNTDEPFPYCGAVTSDRWRVLLDEIAGLPFNPEDRPWDWEGAVPPKIKAQIGALQEALPEQAAEPVQSTDRSRIEALDELGPQLAPDLYVAGPLPDLSLRVASYLSEEVVYERYFSVAVDDVTHIAPDLDLAVELGSDEDLSVELWDLDPAEGRYQFLGGMVFSSTALGAFAECGPWRTDGGPSSAIYDASFEVQAL